MASKQSESKHSKPKEDRKSESEIIVEFKIDGMTCVNCSTALENLMKSEFQSKGLKSVQVALLTHKMRVVFDMTKYREAQIKPCVIKGEIECIGFGAEMIEMIENDMEQLMNYESVVSFGDG